MTYSVKEMFYTLQGEGANAGQPAVFCRFAGCNLWSGREEDRSTAICQFCDTDFVGTDGTLGGKFETATALAELIAAQWPAGAGHRLVVLTGGEPLLQVDTALIDALHAQQFRIAVESNGTVVRSVGNDGLSGRLGLRLQGGADAAGGPGRRCGVLASRGAVRWAPGCPATPRGWRRLGGGFGQRQALAFGRAGGLGFGHGGELCAGGPRFPARAPGIELHRRQRLADEVALGFVAAKGS